MSTYDLYFDIKSCRTIQKKYGKSYYFATYFFPKDLRYATYSLYAFFRLPDEIVDSNDGKNAIFVKKELEFFKQQWISAYNTGESDNSVLRAASFIFKKYDIPFKYSEVFLDAMLEDVYTKRYASYKDLERYMYGSASVVGIMMSYIIGFKNEDALLYAEKLGYAMQLTNFLRDIKEDYLERGRIYMPIEEFRQFGLDEDDISKERISDNFVNFMKFKISQARDLYRQSDKGIPMLARRGRFSVKVASILYENILYEIEKQDYDIYKKRARVSFGKKIILVIKIILKLQ